MSARKSFGIGASAVLATVAVALATTGAGATTVTTDGRDASFVVPVNGGAASVCVPRTSANTQRTCHAVEGVKELILSGQTRTAATSLVLAVTQGAATVDEEDPPTPCGLDINYSLSAYFARSGGGGWVKVEKTTRQPDGTTSAPVLVAFYEQPGGGASENVEGFDICADAPDAPDQDLVVVG